MNKLLDLILKHFKKGLSARELQVLIAHLRDAHESLQQTRLIVETDPEIRARSRENGTEERLDIIQSRLLEVEAQFLVLTEDFENLEPKDGK